MPARRREVILASVCMIRHGRRVPGDAWGLDIASICHDACELANAICQVCPNKAGEDHAPTRPGGPCMPLPKHPTMAYSDSIALPS